MELEHWYWRSHLSLYLLHYSYMELEPIFWLGISTLLTYYIIPIWNWSWFRASNPTILLAYYIIPIWNWSWLTSLLLLNQSNYYIIPIWNWSSRNRSTYTSIYKKLHYSYMELELPKFMLSLPLLVWLHYSYMELELFLIFCKL